MLGWLTSLVGIVTGVFKGLWNDVVSLVTSVYHWFTSEIETVYHDALVAIDGVNHLASAVSNFVSRTYDTFTRWVANEFHTVEVWTSRIVGDAEKYAEDVYGWAVRSVDSLVHQIESAVNSITRWVLANIWNPLYRDITSAIHWIEHEGAFAYDLLTHPEKLVALLIGYIWASWLKLARQYSRPLLAFFLSQWRSATPDLMAIIEDVINAML